MASLREEIEEKTEDVFAEWNEEHDEDEGDYLSDRQRWLKSVKKWVLNDLNTCVILKMIRKCESYESNGSVERYTFPQQKLG